MRDYYLQQMGIERWVSREKTKSQPLMVICEEHNAGPFIGKIGMLFTQMLQSIGLLPEHAYITALGAQLEQKIIRIKPRVILVYAPSIDHHHAFASQDIPVLSSHHPAHLLEYPADKKQAYHDLLRIQQLLCITPDR